MTIARIQDVEFCAGTFPDPQKLVDDFAALSPGLVAVSARVS